MMNIVALQKPRLVWCTHCEINVGCGIYADRPDVCAKFYCLYRLTELLGEHWRPSQCAMVVNYEHQLNRLNISIDGPPEATWRRAPYYREIKAMALRMLRQRGHLLVWEENEAIAVLPHKDVPLGPLSGLVDRVLLVRGRVLPSGAEEFDILAVEKDDPRLTGPGG